MSDPIGPPRLEPGTAAPPSRRALRMAARRPSRAGRNLTAAIAVGSVLGAVVLASLVVRKEAFVGVVAVAVSLALWELAQALGQRGIRIPLVPVTVGAVGMLVAAFTAGGQALAVCFVLTAVGVVVWRTAEGPVGALPDVAGGIFATAYLPLLAGFALLFVVVMYNDTHNWFARLASWVTKLRG